MCDKYCFSDYHYNRIIGIKAQNVHNTTVNIHLQMELFAGGGQQEMSKGVGAVLKCLNCKRKLLLR